MKNPLYLENQGEDKGRLEDDNAKNHHADGCK